MNTITVVYPALITWIAVVLYLVLAVNVSRVRRKFSIKPPFTDGPEAFLLHFRVHQNSGEALILFIPALWLCTLFFSPFWASILGTLWIVGRLIYIAGYSKSSNGRKPGIIISMIAVVLLLLLAFWGILNLILIF